MAQTAWRTAIVVGASSGIGLEIARQLAATGVRVGLVARRAEALEAAIAGIRDAHGGESAVHRVHDVTDYDEAGACWDDLATELGGVDLIVYCAGVMPVVEATEYTFAKDRAMLEVNLLGAVAWLDVAAVRMQSAGHGTIVGVSSVAGDRGRAGQPAYNTSKAALSTFLEALYNRLWRHGIRVVDVRPGPVHTPMTAHLEDLSGALAADEAARLILVAAAAGRRVTYIPVKWRVIMFVIRSIPAFIFRKLNI